MPDLEKCPFCNASPFEDVVYGIKYAVCHTVDCAIHGKCIPVIKWQDRAKVEAVHSTSTNKAMFQLLCDIVDKYVPDGVFNEGDDDLYDRFMATWAQQQHS